MSKIHYFQRYSSLENTVTNNTLQLFAKIYNYSITQASQFLTNLTGESIDLGIEINQQIRAIDGVPDGAVIQNSFKLLIESKVDSPIDIDQLLRHSKGFNSEDQKILLLVTKQSIGTEEGRISKMISEESTGVIFKNVTYEGICDAAKGLFKEYEYEMKDLVADYLGYCTDIGLSDDSKYLMRIVPCGKSLELNKKYGIYFHPTDRGYTKHSYLGIYANRSVHSMWAIDSIFDVEYDGVILTKTYVSGRDISDYDDRIVAIIKDAKEQCDYDIMSGHRFFCGNPVETEYRKSTPGGIMSARYINLKDVLGKLSNTIDLAQKLRGQQWS